MGARQLVLDTGAVFALAEGQVAARQTLTRALRDGFTIVVPAVVVAEAVRGTARDANINRLVKSAQVFPIGEELARNAGALLRATRMDATIDAIVVSVADAGPGSRILTGDVPDITRLAAVAGRTIVLEV